MFNKKQMLALVLGASAMGASYAAKIESAEIQKFKDNMATLTPLVDAFAKKALRGDFEGINDDLSTINLTPAVQFLVNNMDNIQEKLQSFVTIVHENVPADYKAVAQSTDGALREALTDLDQLKTSLETVEPYAELSKYQATIAKAITAANNDKSYRDQLQEVIKASANKLKSLLAQIKNIDIDSIQNSLNSAAVLHTAVKKGEISIATVIKELILGIKEIRTKLLPVAPAIAAELAATTLEIYSVIEKEPAVLAQYQLPSEVIDALGKINAIGIKLQNDFAGLNDKISELAQQALKDF